MEIPNSFYILVGSLIVANIGSIGAFLYFGGKIVWYFSKLDSRVDTIEKGHTKDLNAAHEKIREMKEELKDIRRSN